MTLAVGRARQGALTGWVIGAVAAVAVATALSFLVIFPIDESERPEAFVTRYVVDDRFDRPDGEGLGVTPDGTAWEEVAGTWGIRDGQAVLLRPSDHPRSVAVLRLGSGDGVIEAQAGDLRDGWGLVFRYMGPFNYWSLYATRGEGTFALERIEDGALESSVTLGPVNPDDGSRVRVELLGPTIRIFVDGEVRYTATNAALARAAGVGLLAFGRPAARSTFESFRARIGTPGDG